MRQYIYYTDDILNQIQDMLHLRKDKIRSISGFGFKREIRGEPELSELMTLYAKNLSKLYAFTAGRNNR